MSWDQRLFTYVHAKWRPSGSLTPEWSRWAYGDEVDDSIRRVVTKQTFPELSDDELNRRRLKWASLLQSFQKYGHYSGGNRVTVLEA